MAAALKSKQIDKEVLRQKSKSTRPKCSLRLLKYKSELYRHPHNFLICAHHFITHSHNGL